MYFIFLCLACFRWEGKSVPVTPSWPEADCSRTLAHAVGYLECSSSSFAHLLPAPPSFLRIVPSLPSVDHVMLCDPRTLFPYRKYLNL